MCKTPMSATPILMAVVIILGTETAVAQGVGLGGSNPRLEHQYPANPQYQYPYPYNEPQAKHDRKCPRGHVLYRGRCVVPRPVALPF
jgi:hypothetical protein